MFFPFTIKASTISQLQRETPVFSVAEDVTPDKATRKAQLWSYLNSTAGVIDGKSLKELWFPKGRYHVFLSHSHGDIALARYLKAWLSYFCGLRCFIDTDVWENAYDLLRDLDKKYSKPMESLLMTIIGGTKLRPTYIPYSPWRSLKPLMRLSAR